MFEAFVTLCVLAAAGMANGGDAANCRRALVPGYAAVTADECEAVVKLRPPAISDMDWASPAVCAPRPPSPLVFEAAAPGVFVHMGAVADVDPDNRGDISNIAFVVGSRSVAVIDSGGSAAVGEGVYLAIRERTDLPITHLILTHNHPDHVFGAAPIVAAGAEIWGAATLARALTDRAETYTGNYGGRIGTPGFLGSRIVAPDHGVTDRGTIDLGDRALELRAWPTAHTGSDLTVFDATSGVLFAGDLVFDRHTPALDGSLRGWLRVLSEMAAIPARKMVPGHGGPLLDWPEGAAPERRYLELLARDTRRAIDAGTPLSRAAGEIGRESAGDWRLFDLFNTRNATAAYTELEWE